MSELAVVVGATGAFGRAIVHRLTRRGLRVLAVGRSREDLGALAAEVSLVSPCVADLATDEAIDVVGSAVDGPVRMAVHAAGLSATGTVESLPPSAVGEAANLKAGGLLRLVRAVDPHLRPGSRIVAFAGSLGVEPKPATAAQGTANAAVFNLMRQLSEVYGPRGITTHTLSPGPADTPRLRGLAEAAAAERGVPVDEVMAAYTSAASLGRLPTSDEIAWAVALLLDPEADVLHGSVLHLDAGGHRGTAY